MSPYSEAVAAIDTPLFYENEPYWDFDQTYSDVQSTVQRRMFVILAIVSMIVIALVLFVLPATDSTASAAASSQEVAPASARLATQEARVEEAVAAAPSAAGGSISPIFTKEVKHWESRIVQWASEHELDPNVVATIMQIESCGDPQAVSIAGARGLFQVMPFHFSGSEDMLDPDTNARRGLNFYNEQLRYTGGDKLLSFAGYNGGYAASGGDYATWPDETKRYLQWAQGIYEDATSGATSSETLNAWLAAGGAAGCERAAAQLNLN